MLIQLLGQKIDIIGLLILLLILVFSISIHEFAHALTAYKLGDPTAKLLGRLTLNPLAHLDPMGTITLLVFGFGWGKPTPVNPLNLDDPHRDSALISLAGPASNIILAIMLASILKVSLLWGDVLQSAIFLNVALAVFNLIPIFPLDGFKIVSGVLPYEISNLWEQTAQYGYIIMIGLVFMPMVLGTPSLFSLIVIPISETIIRLIVGS